MCGIAGIVHTDPALPVERAMLEAMAAAMQHRGPDAAGFLVDGPVGFAFRRLSIIDRQGGDQPIFNETGRIGIVFNGEIYNFQELRAELESKGHRFKTRSDTETILHGYEEWGERTLCERLRGMFAFAIHDPDRRRVVLARDRLGIKPLHLLRDEQGVRFSSEIKSLLAISPAPPRISPAALLSYTALGYVPAPESIFAGVEKVLPGHLVVLEDGEVRAQRYWEAHFSHEPQALGPVIERIRELLDDAVRCRLISEVPLGCFLSGGLDSSAVVASMVSELGRTLTSVTVGFADAAFDERGAAMRVADHLGVRPIQEEVVADPDLLDPIAATFDEPFADPSAVPTWLLCRATRRHVTVALSGDGGDELFGGYRRYAFDLAENRVRGILPGPLRRGLFGPLGAILPKADWLPRPLRAKATIQNLARDPVEAYFRSVSRIDPELCERLVAPAQLRAAGAQRPLDRFKEIDARRGLTDPLLRIRAIDLETWLPDDILTKVDRASMAHALEVRVPMLDHPLVEFACRLPAGLLIQGGAGKVALKAAMRGILPDDTIDRRKQGFDLPVAAWLAGPLADELDQMTGSGAPLGEYYDLATARQLLDEHRRGRRNRATELWSLVSFERWRRRWVAR